GEASHQVLGNPRVLVGNQYSDHWAAPTLRGRDGGWPAEGIPQPRCGTSKRRCCVSVTQAAHAEEKGDPEADIASDIRPELADCGDRQLRFGCLVTTVVAMSDPLLRYRG